MNKLEVGMYVRTKYNGIFNIQVLEAIRDIDCDYIEINYIKFPRNEILKASHNIIDPIEKNDFVNGKRVSCKIDKYIYLEDEIRVSSKQIKSIVTKEQFESMSYKVGE